MGKLMNAWNKGKIQGCADSILYWVEKMESNDMTKCIKIDAQNIIEAASEIDDG